MSVVFQVCTHRNCHSCEPESWYPICTYYHSSENKLYGWPHPPPLTGACHWAIPAHAYHRIAQKQPILASYHQLRQRIDTIHRQNYDHTLRRHYSCSSLHDWPRLISCTNCTRLSRPAKNQKKRNAHIIFNHKIVFSVLPEGGDGGGGGGGVGAGGVGGVQERKEDTH